MDFDISDGERALEAIRKSLQSTPDFHGIPGYKERGDGLLIPDTDLIMPESEASPMPTREAFELSVFARHQLEEIVKNYRLTPATLAFKLENKAILPGQKLKWFPSPFLLYISLKIAIGVAKGDARIIISAPPRHGKSRISTIHAPLWVLENFESKNVVTTTYGADLSEDFARLIKDFITENPDLLDVRLRKDANRIAKFLTSKEGALTSIGLGGPITGRGADVLLIDDFIKQIKEALSPTYRDFVYNWFTTTAMTRLEPNASVIIVATRWHRDDLIGRILKNFGTTDTGGEWEHIKSHAIARENDPLGREPGEALFPQRYSVKVLKSREKLLGKMYYDALFDQEPHESDSDLTNKEWIIGIKASEVPDKPWKMARVWDFAGTDDEEKKADPDYTAGGLLACDKETNQTILLEMERGRLSAHKVQKLVEEVADADGPSVDVVICQETGSAGKAVVEFYKSNVLKRQNVYGMYWNTNKVVVAQPWLAACEAGEFFMLDDGITEEQLLANTSSGSSTELVSWNRVFLKEYETFPTIGTGYHDDQCDVCANGYLHLMGKVKRRSSFGRKLQQQLQAMPTDEELKKMTPEKAAEVVRNLHLAERRSSSSSTRSSPVDGVKNLKKAVFSVRRGATFGRTKTTTYY